MGNQDKRTAKEDRTPVKRSAEPRKKGPRQSLTLFEWLDAWLDRHLDRIFWIILSLSVMTAILMFDIRFSVSGDDSAYVIRAHDFVKEFTYPGFQGPLYPFVLSPMVLLFGVNAIALKSLSILFLAGFLYFTFRTFRHRIPATLAMAALLLISFNSFILYFASQTYSEMFFMFLQALMIFTLFTLFPEKGESKPLSSAWRSYFLLGLCILALGLTRSIGFTAAMVVPAFFLLRGSWRDLLLIVAVTLVLIVAFQGFKYLVWGSADFNLSDQGNALLNKNYYKPSMGREDLAGFLDRLVKNSNSYISRHFYTMFGFRPFNVELSILPWLNVLTWVVLFGGVILYFRKNRYLLYLALHAVVFLAVSFIILQTNWEQTRIILPFVLYLMTGLLATFYYILSIKPLTRFQWIFPLGILVIMGLNLSATSVVFREARKVDGIYYGLTPDWENYAKMSKWASDNLPDTAVVACRKPSISFIYGNKARFFGIMALPNYSVGRLMEEWKTKKIPYILVESEDLNGKNFTQGTVRAFKNGLIAEVNKEGSKRFLLNLPDSTRERSLAELQALKIGYSANADSCAAAFTHENGYYAVYPDSLVDILRKAHVTHVLTANLRTRSDRKTKETINTIERFSSIIANKYPQFFTKIAQQGNDDNEPAAIFRVDYSKCVVMK